MQGPRFAELRLDLTLERPVGAGVNQNTPQGFSDLKLKFSSNQSETFSTCSPIMNASFDINLMTPSLIIYVKLIMQTKVWIRKM